MWVPLMTDQLSSYVHDLSDNENIDAWWMKTGHMRLSNVMSYMTVKYELYTHTYEITQHHMPRRTLVLAISKHYVYHCLTKFSIPLAAL